MPDIDALTRRHWEEIGHYADMPSDPDYARYQEVEAAGHLRAYTARVGRELVGYTTFFVGKGLHYRTVLIATEVATYLAPEHRKGLTGMRFMKFVDTELAAEGVQVISRHVKHRRDFGPVLERMGYEVQDVVYTKKL